jgi:predicted RNA-binding protein with PUA-like domain
VAYWLMKSDPDAYGFADLERDGGTTWDGVTNSLALQHLRRIRRGDRILIYHSGAEKAVVGLAEATSDGYADPSESGGKLAVVDLRPLRRLARPVPLAAIKAEPRCADFELVRLPRLSVMPVPAPLYERIVKMSG